MMRLVTYAISHVSLALYFSLALSWAANENIIFPEDAGLVNVKTDYGAVGDGKTDDTNAIQQAVEESKGKNLTLYFPNGTYLVSGSVGLFDGKAHGRERFLSWQGQSRSGTVIKLKDRAAGFQDPEKPKILVSVYEGKSTGDVMHSYFRNLTVDVGSGNSGAVGVRFFSNNTGAMEYCAIRSSDPEGAGAIGLDLAQSQNGPILIKHVIIEGFDCAIKSKNSFSLVMEHIKVINPREVGYHNNTSRMTARDLDVTGAPIGIKNGKDAQLFLIDSRFSSKGNEDAAIILDGNKVYLRDIQQTGYNAIVQDRNGKKKKASSIEEWSPLPFYNISGQDPNAKSLRLTIEETPEIPWEQDLSKWIKVDIANQNDYTDALQKAIDEGVKRGATTIYFPKMRGKRTNGKRYVPTQSGPIRIHGSINRIIGLSNLVKIHDPKGLFKSSGKAAFTFEDLKSDTIIVERFFSLGGWDFIPTPLFENKSKTKIVLKNFGVGIGFKKPDPDGTWFIEDVAPGTKRATIPIGKNEKLWARQFNPEGAKHSYVHVDGGQVWCLGLKTEGRATHFKLENNAKLEVIGGVSYQSWGKQPYDPPMFDITNSQASLSLGFYHWKFPFTTIVREIDASSEKELDRSELKANFLPLFRTTN